MSQLVNHRWQVAARDFAVRITIPDVKGFFDSIPLISGLPAARSLVIEPGTRSAIIENGVLLAEIYAGEYTLESFIERFKFWKNRQSTVYLTRAEDVVLQVNATHLPTVEGVCVDVTSQWTVQMSHVVLFVENLMGPRESLTMDELAAFLVPMLQQAVRECVGQSRCDSLVDGPVSGLLQDGVIGRIKVKLSRLGLIVTNLQAVEVTAQDGGLQAWHGELWLTQRENQLRRAANEIDNAKVQDDADDMRKKVDLRVRLRELVTEDRLNKTRNREDFERGVLEVDKDRLLREDERESLVRAYEERKDDHQSLRQHFLAIVDLQREQEIDALRLSVEHAARMKALEQEILQAQQIRTAESEKWQAELQRERQQLTHQNEQRYRDHQAKWARLRDTRQQRRDEDWEGLLHEQRTEEIKAKLELARAERQRQLSVVQAELESRLTHEKLELRKREEAWELESREKRSTSQLDRLQRVQEMNSQFAEREQRLKLELETLQQDQASKRELERIQVMSGVGTEVLIATAGATNAQLLADLKKHEASQEAVRAQASAAPMVELNAERVRLYEQMNATERAKADAVAEAYKMAMQAQQQSVNQMIGGLAQAATPVGPMVAGAGRGAPPVPAEVWYYAANGQSSAPQSRAQMEQAVRVGLVQAGTQVWKAGLANWMAAGQVPELAALFGPPPLSGAGGPPPLT